jgi:hypothetical protein
MAEPIGTTSAVVRPHAQDLPITRTQYREAVDRGLSFSAYLEELDPSDGYNDGLDAFQRQLAVADIRVRSDLANGVPAHRVERFWNSAKSGSENLFPEYVNRVYRAVTLAGFDDQQNRFYASSVPVSAVLNPAVLDQIVRQKQIAPAIPLSAIIAFTNTIDGAAYVSHYLTDDSDERTMKRVSEGSEIPTAILTGSDHTIRLRKYGRKLRASYEAIRRSPIDRLALHLALLAVQAEADKVNTAIDVAINGDGNTNSASNSNLTTLDTTTTAGNLTLKAYLAWRMAWPNPYNCSVIVGQNAYILQALLMNTGSANTPFAQFQGSWGIGGFQPINPNLGATRIGWLTNTGLSTKLLGIDARFGLEMVVEAGATLTETDRLISTQFNEIVMSESVAFAVLDANANKTLDTGA